VCKTSTCLTPVLRGRKQGACKQHKAVWVLVGTGGLQHQV